MVLNRFVVYTIIFHFSFVYIFQLDTKQYILVEALFIERY